MKRDFIKLAEQYVKQGFLQNRYKILTKKGSDYVKKLKLEEISYGFIVYENL